jgi:hypothetical protein
MLGNFKEGETHTQSCLGYEHSSGHEVVTEISLKYFMEGHRIK